MEIEGEYMNENSQDEIDLTEIYIVIKRNILNILLISIIASITVFAYTKVFVKKQYVSNGTIIVNNRKDESSGSITNDEINSAKGLTSVYSIIIKSDPIMQAVIDNLSLDYTVSQLQSKVSVNSVDATQVMRISARTNSPETSASIVNEILKIAPDHIIDKVEAGSVKIISEGKVNISAVAPNATRNSMLIFVISVMGLSGIFVVIELLDKTIKSEQDMVQDLGIPLLGIIPNVNSVRGNSK